MALHALLASLPMLRLGESSFMTIEHFLSDCESCLSAQEMEGLRSLSLVPEAEKQYPAGLAARYMQWERSLRNALVNLRAARCGGESSEWLDAEAAFETTAVSAAQTAFSAADPLEREKLLDQARWNRIDELEQGKLFSFDQVCGYYLKLLLCAKWNARLAESAVQNLDKAAADVIASQK